MGHTGGAEPAGQGIPGADMKLNVQLYIFNIPVVMTIL